MKKIFLCLAVIALSFALTFSALAVGGSTADVVALAPGPAVSLPTTADLALDDAWAILGAAFALLGAAVTLASLIAPFTKTTTDDRVLRALKNILDRLSLLPVGLLRPGNAGSGSNGVRPVNR